MFKKRSSLLLVALLLLGLASSYAQEANNAIPRSGSTTPEGWYDDYDVAIKAAETQNRNVYALFTGSDWCGWCIKLKAEVLEKKEFKDYAKDKLILLYIDLPRKVQLSDEMQAKNRALLQKYGVSGFPTTLLLDAKGKELQKINSFADNLYDQLDKAIK
ncbi:MAG: thioredoxin family protein [Lentisphaeria bacterium]|nr:thioredoxin family protein [Lentisphaeria bacterium]